MREVGVLYTEFDDLRAKVQTWFSSQYPPDWNDHEKWKEKIFRLAEDEPAKGDPFCTEIGAQAQNNRAYAYQHSHGVNRDEQLAAF